MSFSWKNLPKPIFVLAPMEDVTDCAFREMFAKYGHPDVMFTEFVSTDGLMHPEGRKKLSIDLTYTEIQRPMVAQIWGRDPEKYYQVAQYLVELGFDGIDINFGCPQSKEIQAGTCAALIREPELAVEIIKATKKGAGSLPVSVKTRIGYSKTEEMEEWMKYLLNTEIENLTLHARTKQEMSKVPAHWELMPLAATIKNRLNPEVTLLGNGDVMSREDGLAKIAASGIDGVMIGRGAFGNPWAFSQAGYVPGVKERLTVMLEHAELFDKMFSGIKSFSIMRKHFKAYASGFDGASELRARLMEVKDLAETKSIVEGFLSSLS